jgi:hypothetical protein
MHDLPSLILHLHLFLGVPVRLEGIDLGKDVEGDLVRINLAGDRLTGGDLLDLAFEFLDGLGTGAGDCLVAGSDDALHAERPMQRIEGHQGDGGGAVRVGQDSVVIADIRSIDLGHDQRDAIVLAEGGRVVDDHAPGGGRNGGELAGDGTAGAEQGDVDALEAVLGELRDGDFLAGKGQFLADRTGRGKQGELANGEAASFENLQHLDTNGASCPDHGDVRSLVHQKRGRVRRAMGLSMEMSGRS